jgi:hypothetical protein
VLLVFDFAVLGVAKGGAQDADGVLAVALDFEMDWGACFDGSKCGISQLTQGKRFQMYGYNGNVNLPSA